VDTDNGRVYKTIKKKIKDFAIIDDEHAHGGTPVRACPMRRRSVFNRPTSDGKSITDNIFLIAVSSEKARTGPGSGVCERTFNRLSTWYKLPTNSPFVIENRNRRDFQSLYDDA